MTARIGRRSLAAVAGAVLVVTCAAACGADAAPSTVPSPAAVAETSTSMADVLTYKGGNTRTGVMPGPGPATQPEVLWEHPLSDVSESQPLVVDGKVLVATTGDVLLEIDPATGAVLEHALPAGVGSNPAADGETIYVVTKDGVLRAISLADWTERWHAPGPYSPQTTLAVSDGLVIAGGPGVLVAVSAAGGAPAWSVPAEASTRISVDAGMAYASGDRSAVMTVVDVTRGALVRSDRIGGA
ncbi:MAG: PQQ-binding-like beta-propeller repeat protein, partial [Chloroflexota bacterium]